MRFSFGSRLNAAFGAALAVGCTLAAQTPWLTVDGRAIPASEVGKANPGAYLKAETAAYQERQKLVDAFLREHLFGLEAHRLRVSLEQFRQQEIEAHLSPVTDREVRSLYASLKTVLNGEIGPFDSVRPTLERQILDTARQERSEQVYRGLLARHQVAIHLERPRVIVGLGDLPPSGPDNAPITLVAFVDFQCPYCRKLEETVIPNLLKAYSGKLRLLHRDFPLRNHARALPAAVAARSAARQGQFWPYRQRLLLSTNLGEDDLLRAAQEVGLDLARFQADRKDPELQAAAARDQAEAERLGVDGTPSVFVNGIPMHGALPLEDFKAIIDEELGLRPRGVLPKDVGAGGPLKEACSDAKAGAP